MKKVFIYILSIVFLCGSPVITKAQESSYLPKGDPDKWNVELTPFLWLPLISGTVGSEKISEDYDIPASDLVSNIKMAFMISGDVSKGKFFMSPTWVYNKLGTENEIWVSPSGNNEIIAIPDIKMNIFEFIAGARLRVDDSFIFDPFVGFRYTNYHLHASIEKPTGTKEFDEKADFWDPVVGFQMHYFPHPRVPITAKIDVGGFGAGSKFSWVTSIFSGYTLSPSFDLLAGFTAYRTNFEKDNSLGNTIGLDMTMYGFDLGIKYHIPKRARDKSVFKKKK